MGHKSIQYFPRVRRSPSTNAPFPAPAFADGWNLTNIQNFLETLVRTTELDPYRREKEQGDDLRNTAWHIDSNWHPVNPSNNGYNPNYIEVDHKKISKVYSGTNVKTVVGVIMGVSAIVVFMCLIIRFLQRRESNVSILPPNDRHQNLVNSDCTNSQTANHFNVPLIYASISASSSLHSLLDTNEGVNPSRHHLLDLPPTYASSVNNSARSSVCSFRDVADGANNLLDLPPTYASSTNNSARSSLCSFHITNDESEDPSLNADHSGSLPPSYDEVMAKISAPTDCSRNAPGSGNRSE